MLTVCVRELREHHDEAVAIRTRGLVIYNKRMDRGRMHLVERAQYCIPPVWSDKTCKYFFFCSTKKHRHWDSAVL